MRTLPISDVKDRLVELVDSASFTHEQITITKNGWPTAVLVGAADWDALQETLFWLSQEGNRETLAVARDEIADGKGLREERIRTELGQRQRST
jgi:prevent-host-death family protein